MLFFKKKKTPTEIAQQTEVALSDNFVMLFNLYTSCIREDDYNKVGNEAQSMLGAYDRYDRVKEMYENELTICRNDLEYAFVDASEQYVLAVVELLAEIFKDVVMIKKNMKRMRAMGFEGASKEEIDAFAIDHDTIKAKLPSYDERYKKVIELRTKRDEAFSQLD